jgi:hypothetical protein
MVLNLFEFIIIWCYFIDSLVWDFSQINYKCLKLTEVCQAPSSVDLSLTYTLQSPQELLHIPMSRPCSRPTTSEPLDLVPDISIF